MSAFFQNCPRDYDEDIELQGMRQQVKTVTSPRECVDELINLTQKK
jgi:hypothetical protein